jgi:hypothetical protein
MCLIVPLNPFTPGMKREKISKHGLAFYFKTNDKAISCSLMDFVNQALYQIISQFYHTKD